MCTSSNYMKPRSVFKTFFLPLIIALALFSIFGLTYKKYKPIPSKTIIERQQDSIILNNVTKVKFVNDSIVKIYYNPSEANSVKLDRIIK